MIILNSSKSVKVLKAMGLPALRLFPGHNAVGEKIINRYFENTAAKGMRKDCLSVVDEAQIAEEHRLQAEAAKAKNDELNKAQRIIQQNNEKIAEKEDKITEQGKVISDLTDLVKDLQKEVKKLKKG